MKAVVTTRAGSPDRLQVQDVPTPEPGPGEVLIRVAVTTVTRGDVVLRKMPRLVTRLFGETPKSILGHEFAGCVESVGPGVGEFVVGDRVFGSTSGLARGSHAEMVVVPADGLVTRIPVGVSYDDAASAPVGAMAALHFLEEAGVKPGSRVLINGASGSVGSFAVQIAKHKGAHVTGVAGADNAELIESLGAERAIDYRTQDFRDEGIEYDVVFDVAGKLQRKDVDRSLVSGGRFVTTRSRRAESLEELNTVRDLLSRGAIRSVVDRKYRLDEVAEAHRYVEGGRKRGNVLLVVDENGECNG